MQWTYRKAVNRGFVPVWYRTDRGTRIAWVEKEGPKWMWVRFGSDGLRKRCPVSDKRYMTPLRSKRG